MTNQLTITAPERIWLQVNPEDPRGNEEPFPSDHDGITWCRDSVGGDEVEYVRADLAGVKQSLTPQTPIDRSAAVNLARNTLSDPDGYRLHRVTVLGVKTLAEAVLAMDAALLAATEQSSVVGRDYPPTSEIIRLAQVACHEEPEVKTTDAQRAAFAVCRMLIEQPAEVEQEPVVWLVYLPSEETQRVYDSQDDVGYVDDLTNHGDAQVQPLYTHPAPQPDQIQAAIEAEREACAEHYLGIMRAAVAEDARDAARWRHIEKQFAVMSLDINGNHSWAWRGSPARLRGPSFGAAVDAAMAKDKEQL